MARDDIVGLDELQRAVRRLGEKVPQIAATRAARAGAKIAFKAAKANAPIDTADLKNGLVMKPEKRTTKGKKMFDIMLDPLKNNVFVKVSKVGKRSYYPASQEYGYLTVSGRYIPGYRYLRKSITENKREIETTIVRIGIEEVDKAWNARNAR
ncbi:HK97 gp10 family phage protein [Bacillus sp. FJAT-26390]|uniref:HK97 gp10 family phage protein n=1 Tax=Bacillus sp. FJAT-26390 TaxID=1743142 RepID=UPI000807DA49|nr:HK97 gp10 family phage protein [Bacillus sp. FJAT-26390]OBZ13338.1 hypothetical protein A7975_10805 [Bacillus sp. FJAT-26390]